MAQGTLAGPQNRSGGQQQRGGDPRDEPRGDQRQSRQQDTGGNGETREAYAKRMFQELRAQLNSKSFRERLLAQTVEEFRTVGYIERLVENIFNACRAEPKLLTECDRASLFRAAEKVAKMGLTVGDNVTWLIPYQGQVQYQMGYKGAMILVMRSQLVSKFTCQPVFANDKCDISLGSDQRISHHPPLGDRGAFIGVYAIAWLKDVAEPEIEWMSKQEVDYIRGKSPGRNSPAWNNWYSEMARAKVLKRITKRLPTERPVDLDDDDDKVIEGTASVDLTDNWGDFSGQSQIEDTSARDERVPMDTGRQQQDQREAEPARQQQDAKPTQQRRQTKPAEPEPRREPEPEQRQDPPTDEDEDTYVTDDQGGSEYSDE